MCCQLHYTLHVLCPREQIHRLHLHGLIAMLGLHKLGAVAIPATHMLTKHDIVYRNNAASVKAIICCGDDYVVEHFLGKEEVLSSTLSYSSIVLDA